MDAEARTVAAETTPVRDEGAEMLARHLEGDPRAFGELVDRYGRGVYAFLQRSGVGATAADDLFQETFLRVHRSARRFDSDHSFRGWLYTITANLVRSHYRKQKVRRVLTSLWRRPAADPHAPAEALDPPDPAAGPEQRVRDRQQVQLVEQALAGLADGPRQALLLTQVEGLDLKEAARALGVPLPTVKTWVRRGRLKLAEALLEAEGPAPIEAAPDRTDEVES